jgi:hypothetical protein
MQARHMPCPARRIPTTSPRPKQPFWAEGLTWRLRAIVARQ